MSVINFSASEISLTIQNFNQIPADVGVDVDVRAILVDQNGFTQTNIDGDVTFLSDQINSIASANSNLISSTFNVLPDEAITPQYLAKNEISANLLGQFYLGGNEFFNFDLQASLNLKTFTNNLTVNSLSSSGNISLILQNSVNQEIIDFFHLFGIVNTNSTEKMNEDFFMFRTSPNFTITEYQEDIFFNELSHQEYINVTTNGLFQTYFEEPTLINLIAVTQSCNYSSDAVDVCVKIIEPSSNFALILLLFCLGGRTIFLRIVK